VSGGSCVVGEREGMGNIFREVCCIIMEWRVMNVDGIGV
jgi:hypothetical protein